VAKADYLYPEKAFGTPKDDFERAAHLWLIENAGQEGERCMKSLAKLLRRFDAGPVQRGVAELLASRAEAHWRAQNQDPRYHDEFVRVDRSFYRELVGFLRRLQGDYGKPACSLCHGWGFVHRMDETEIGQPPGSSAVTCPECKRASAVPNGPQ